MTSANKKWTRLVLLLFCAMAAIGVGCNSKPALTESPVTMNDEEQRHRYAEHKLAAYAEYKLAAENVISQLEKMKTLRDEDVGETKWKLAMVDVDESMTKLETSTANLDLTTLASYRAIRDAVRYYRGKYTEDECPVDLKKQMILADDASRRQKENPQDIAIGGEALEATGKCLDMLRSWLKQAGSAKTEEAKAALAEGR